MYRTTKIHVMRRLLILAIAAVLAGFGMAPAHAITQGQPDGGLHPNVGAVVADYDGESPGPDIVCSGTLIAPTVFLTVAHCIAFIQSQDLDVWVSFDPTYNEEEAAPTGLFGGTAVRNPLFGQSGGVSDTHDVAVILLEESPGITPATLPTAGFLDDQAADHSLQNQAFTTVGYGWTRIDKTGGPKSSVFRDGVRRYANQTFNSSSPAGSRSRRTRRSTTAVDAGTTPVAALLRRRDKQPGRLDHCQRRRVVSLARQDLSARHPVGPGLPPPVRHAALTGTRHRATRAR